MGNFAVEQKYIIRFDDGRVTPHNYDRVIEFEESAIGIVNVGERINAEAYSKTDGKQLFAFFEAESLKEYTNSCIIETKEKHFYVFFDTNQKIHGPYAEAMESYGAIKVSKNFKRQNEIVRLYGVYSKEGRFVIPINYEYISLYSDVVIAHQKGKAGMFSYEGKCLLKHEYDRIIVTGVNPVIVKVWKDEKVGIANTEGKVVIPIVYKEIRDYRCLGETVFVVAKELFQNGIFYSCSNANRYKSLPEIFEEVCVYEEHPFIKLELKNDVLYYSIKLHKFFQKECVKFKKNKVKYFMDGKWHVFHVNKK